MLIANIELPRKQSKPTQIVLTERGTNQAGAHLSGGGFINRNSWLLIVDLAALKGCAPQTYGNIPTTTTHVDVAASPDVVQYKTAWYSLSRRQLGDHCGTNGGWGYNLVSLGGQLGDKCGTVG